MTQEIKALSISKAINAIATHFECSAKLLIGSYRGHENKVRMARHLLWHHLNASGMTFDDMASLFATSASHLASSARVAMIRKTEEEQRLLNTIPLNLGTNKQEALRA